MPKRICAGVAPEPHDDKRAVPSASAGSKMSSVPVLIRGGHLSMNTEIDSARYRKCLHNSQKVTWDIDADVIRFRQLDTANKFLPDSLSLVTQLPFLSEPQQRLLSQIQGRTYAYLFGLIERCINAKVLEMGRAHCLSDQIAVAALLKFVQEELKHQELFRRVEKLADLVLPAGYRMSTRS